MSQVNECQQEANAFIFFLSLCLAKIYLFLEIPNFLIPNNLYDQKYKGFLSSVHFHVSLLVDNSTVTKH